MVAAADNKCRAGQGGNFLPRLFFCRFKAAVLSSRLGADAENPQQPNEHPSNKSAKGISDSRRDSVGKGYKIRSHMAGSWG